MIGGVLVSVVGYYTPFMIGGMFIFTIGMGLLSTLKVDTSIGLWVGYQIIPGLGVGICLQVLYCLNLADLATSHLSASCGFSPRHSYSYHTRYILSATRWDAVHLSGPICFGK